MARRFAFRSPSCGRPFRRSIPIRRYPDITHSRQCQFPVPDWDLAYAATEGARSSIRGRGTKPRSFAAGRPIRSASSAIPRAATTTSTSSSGAASVGIPTAGGRNPAAVCPLLHQRCARRRFRPGAIGTGAKLARTAADKPRRANDARPVPVDGKVRPAGDLGELAISTGALSGVLRRLRAPSFDLRNEPSKSTRWQSSATRESRGRSSPCGKPKSCSTKPLRIR